MRQDSSIEIMKNPPTILRGLFVAFMGFLLVSVLFSVTGIPAAQLFSCVGGLAALSLYVVFSMATSQKKKSDHARHIMFLALVVAIILKSFDIAVGTYLFLLAFVAFLIWFTWQVLEQLPPAEKD